MGMSLLKKLTRSSNKMVEGVIGGFAEYIDIDPVWLRLGYVFLALAGNFWIAFFVYIAAAIIMPKADENTVHIEEQEIKINNRGSLFVGLVLIFFGIIFLINQISHIDLWNYLSTIYYEIRFYAWAIILITLGILIIIRGKK